MATRRNKRAKFEHLKRNVSFVRYRTKSFKFTNKKFVSTPPEFFVLKRSCENSKLGSLVVKINIMYSTVKNYEINCTEFTAIIMGIVNHKYFACSLFLLRTQRTEEFFEQSDYNGAHKLRRVRKTKMKNKSARSKPVGKKFFVSRVDCKKNKRTLKK